LTLNYKFAIQGISKSYIRVSSMISLIRVLKIYRRITEWDKKLAFKVSTYPDFSLTCKPKAVRMGKGKGPISYTIAKFKKGGIIFQWRIMRALYCMTFKNKNLRILFLVQLLLLVKQFKIRIQTKNIFKYNYW